MEIAFQKYLDSYKEVCPALTLGELEFIRAHLSVSHYQKKEFHLKSGQVQRAMGFVYSGLLRSYYVDEQGKKVTISFIHEGGYSADYPSFLRQKPSKYYIECLEPTVMVHLPYSTIQAAYDQYKNFERYGRLIAEALLVQKQDRIESFQFEAAEERYLYFLKHNSHLVNRVSISHLSSYLGIERQSLSRIRQKLARQ